MSGSGSGLRPRKNMTKFKLFILSTLLFLSLSIFAHSVILRTMHVKNLPTTLKVTLYFSSSTQYRAFMMQHPTRFVVDLQNVKTFKHLSLPYYAKSTITAFRYATHRDGIFRIVFELNKTTKPKIKTLSANLHHLAQLQIIFPKGKNILSNIVLPQPKTEKHTIITDTEDAAINHHRNIIVVIDPGHGGKDPGAAGINGTKEKNIVLSISKKLQKEINKIPGFHAVLTRTSDYYLTLRQRLAIARKDKADMFIAIHADKWRNTEAQGVSVFALSQRGATSEAARWLAHKENKSELMGGVQLQDQSHLLKSVLINLSQSATIRESVQIGTNLLHSVKPIARLHHNTVEQAAFVVLKSPDIPSLLIETGFLSNPNEESRLSNSNYQHELAASITQGIYRYFIQHPPHGTVIG